jgi:hypothetical protein
MEKIWKVLFVDDDHRYAEPLIDRAYSAGLELEYYDNWEEAFSMLQEDFNKYHGVIIDGKGKLTKDSRGDDQRHVNRAIGDLRELKGKKQLIPFVVLSKYIELKDTIDEPFFEKGKDEQEMFKYLIRNIQNSETNIIKAKYKDVFEVFELSYLDKTTENHLTEAIKTFENGNLTGGSYTLLRMILESIYKSLHELDDKLIPYRCLRFDNDKINFTLCERRLKGLAINDRTTHKLLFPEETPVLPEFISSVISEYTRLFNRSVHAEHNDIITRYTYGGALFFMMDLLLWFKEFVAGHLGR